MDSTDRRSEPARSGPGSESAPTGAVNRLVDERTVLMSHISIGHTLPGGVANVADVPARQVGRYQIMEKLGEGAMATVYRAYDPSIDRMLAIKFLHRDLCVDAEYRGRFLREAKAAGVLSHPNIVTVFDVGEIEGRPYIAMELLDGGPLNATLKDGVGMPVKQVLDVGIQLAGALDYAHARGIFHRDIKPSNIVRLADGKTIKVTDFGIAHVESSGGTTQQTRVGTVIGTPHYMSPEQAMGQRVDARSDLFSAGVMLYQLVTGHRPFDGESIVSLAVKIAKEDPKPIGQLREGVPPALRRIVDRCLAKQPEKRFQSGAELAQALTRVKEELAAEADKKGRPRIVPLRVKWTLTMAVVVAVTMALTAMFVNHRQYQAMMGQMISQGATLSKLIAAESAVAVLGEDWVAVDISVQEAAKALGAPGLSVIDRNGAVRVSSNARTVGQAFDQAGGQALAALDGGVEVRRRDLNGASVLDFVTPVTFGDKRVGTVNLLLPEKPLADVARQSWLLMALLVLVTAAAVTAATYFIADRYSKPIRLVRDSMDEIGKGRFDYRIAEKRDDEFGELYAAFDRMAGQLEASKSPGGALKTPGDRTIVAAPRR